MENITLMNVGKANQTISSREIAELTGKDHRNVLRDCDTLNESYLKLGLAQISAGVYYHPNTGKQQHRELLLTRMQTFDLMTGYNIELRIKVNRRWEELEATSRQLDFSDPATVLQLAQNWAEAERKAKELAQQNERLAIQNEYQTKSLIEAKPKVEYYEQVMQSESLITTTIIAKELGMSAVTLNKLLHKHQVQYLVGETWVLYHRYQGKGYTGTKTSTYKDSTGKDKTSVLTCWTEKGREFIHEFVTAHLNSK